MRGISYFQTFSKCVKYESFESKSLSEKKCILLEVLITAQFKFKVNDFFELFFQWKLNNRAKSKLLFGNFIRFIDKDFHFNLSRMHFNSCAFVLQGVPESMDKTKNHVHNFGTLCT